MKTQSLRLSDPDVSVDLRVNAHPEEPCMGTSPRFPRMPRRIDCAMELFTHGKSITLRLTEDDVAELRAALVAIEEMFL